MFLREQAERERGGGQFIARVFVISNYLPAASVILNVSNIKNWIGKFDVKLFLSLSGILIENHPISDQARAPKRPKNIVVLGYNT